MTHKVTLEPVGIKMDVEEDETVLEAAFRQGIALMHGCKEGQCSTCKSMLIDGDIEMERYSTFALNEMEKEEGYILLCKTLAFSDLTVELMQFDEEALKMSVPIKTSSTVVENIESLTHDIRKLSLKIENSEQLTFHSGQFVDIYLPGEDTYRSYSMANTPSQSDRLEFMIKIFKGGKFSTLLDEKLKAGDQLTIRGPFGNCIRREENKGDMILLGGGSGMAPLWSILNDMVEKKVKRKITFFYGARSKKDLFYVEKFKQIESQLEDFTFVPALSESVPSDDWDGEIGFITEVLERHVDPIIAKDHLEAFLCGPAPMIDASIDILKRKGVTSDRIFFDKFVPASV